MRLLLSGLLATCVVVSPLSAQAVSNSDCQNAAAFVSGQPLPAVSDTTNNSWSTLALCRDIGEAAALQALQTSIVISEQDSTRVLELFGLFGGRRSIAFFNAWQAVIVNPQASNIFKLRAIRAYGSAYSPGTSFTQASPTARTAASCGFTDVDDPPALSSLPPGSVSQIIATMAAAATNGANSAAVRGLANCWMLTLQLDLPAVASKISGAYVCGNTFTITNTNPMEVVIHADVIPPTALQKIEHHVSSISGNGDVWTLVAQLRGNLRLTFNNAVIQTVVNMGTVCH